MALADLQKLASELPDGPFWPSGKWFKRLLDSLIRDRACLIPGDGAEIPSDSGRFFDVVAGGGNNAGAVPFQVINASTSNGSGGVDIKVKVSLDSWLSRSVRPADKLTITGLGAPFEISLGYRIWLKVAWDPLNLSAPPTATIVHGAPGTLWPDYDDPALFDDLEEGNPKQLEWRELIAWTEALAADAAADPYLDSLVVGSGEEAFRVIQRVTMHLVLCKRCFENNNVWVTDPAFRPGPED